jgi:hypothetical protein
MKLAFPATDLKTSRLQLAALLHGFDMSMTLLVAYHL